MKRREKLIMYIWLLSLAIILLIGVILCLQRPSSEIVQANKDIMTTAEKIRTYYRNRPDYWGLDGKMAISNNLYTGTLTNNQIFNGLNKAIVIGSDINGSTVMPGQRSFVIGYRDLNKKECVELSSFRWQEEDKLGLLSLSLQNGEGVYEFSWGDKGLPLSHSKAKQYCKENNHLLWTFE